jgi:phospholipid-binding lipoprotein MlaA
MKMQVNREAGGHRWWWVLALCSALLAGCATGPAAQPHDPLEPFNRSMQHFNDSVDDAVLKPVATTYRDHLPSPLRTGVHNFFGNLRDLWSSLNAVLQVRPREAAENFMRFNVNTFLGFGGVLDIASEMGIERTTLDMGHTLGRWGVPAGPYLVLPLLGPSSVRDATGLVLDRQGDWLSQGVDTESVRNGLTALRVVDTRASLLGASNLLEQAALDKYSFVRDAYLQRRQSQINVGRPEPQEADGE